MGDAAHTHGGAFAAGGSLAIDDAFALYLAVKHAFVRPGPVSTIERIDRALRLYEKTRRPHTSRLQNVIMKGLNQPPSSAGLSATDNYELLLARKIANKPNTSWLSEHDVEKAFGEVVSEYQVGSKM